MRAKWLKFSILASIKVRAGGQSIAPKTRTTLILDRYGQLIKKNENHEKINFYFVYGDSYIIV